MRRSLRLCLLAHLFLSLAAQGLHANVLDGATLFKGPRISSPTLSPGGEYLAAFIREQDERGLFIIDTSEGLYYPLLGFDDNSKIRAFTWIDSDTLHVTYTVFNRLKQELIDLNIEDLSRPRSGLRITEPGYLLDPLSGESDEFLFVRTSGDGSRVFRISASSLRAGRFMKADGVELPDTQVDRYGYDAASGTYFAHRYDADTEQYSAAYLVPGATAWSPLFSSDDGRLTFVPVAMLDGQAFAVLSNLDSDKVALHVYDAHSGKFGEVLYEHARYDLVGAQVDPDSGDVISVSYFDHGRYVREYVRREDLAGLVGLERAFPGKQMAILSQNEGTPVQVLGVFGDNDPGTVYLYDTSSKRATLVEHVNPDLQGLRLPASEVISTTIEDGTQLEGYLTRPLENENGVLLVMPHGGPIGIRDFNRFTPEVHYLASRGYAVLRVNFRGSGGFGRAFSDAGKGQFGGLIESDIRAVVDAVRRRYPYERSCAIGSSYGGYSAFMLALRDPDFYHCAVVMYGIYDLPLLFNASKRKAEARYRDATGEVVGTDMPALRERSPVYLADELAQPVLVIAGTEDRVADFEHSNRLKYVLKRLNKDFEFLFYGGVGHGQGTFRGEWHQFALLDDFIRRRLQLDDLTTGETAVILQRESAMLGRSFDKHGELADPELAKYFFEKAARAGD